MAKKYKSEPVELILGENLQDISLSTKVDCPFCEKAQSIVILYTEDLPVTHYCSCGKVFKFRLKLNKKKKDCLLLKFEVVKTNLRGKKLNKGG